MPRRLVRIARRLGLHAVEADHYSPVLEPGMLPATFWEEPAEMPGLRLALDDQLARLSGELLPLAAELAIPLNGEGLHLDNGWYGPLDAHVLYGFIRAQPPRQIVEFGSGYSTLLIQQALRDAQASGVRHTVIDPFPSPQLGSVRRALAVMPISGARVPSRLLAELSAGDLLFVDSSHVVKEGGEVIRIVLEELPRLAPGVLVHFHDFFRPFPYPRVFPEQFNVHWQEQYLLQAFLAYNPHFELLMTNHALWRLRRAQVRELIPTLREGMEPSAMWLRRH